MKRNILTQGNRDERPSTSWKDERTSLPHSRSDEERRRRRREWLIQQELEKEHERLKKKMILEYELKRAREQGLKPISGRSANRSRSQSKSKSRSRSLGDLHRRDTKGSSSKPLVMSGKMDTSSGVTPLFKGPEGTQISASELRRIKVDIHRNLPLQGELNELQRDIINPEDVTIIRRRGEGSKPIFEREEIKGTSNEVKEVEEHRTVVSLDNNDSVKGAGTFHRPTPSSRSSPNRSRSPQPSTSQRSRSRDSQNGNCKFDRHSSRRTDRRSSRGKSKDSERKYKGHESSRDRENSLGYKNRRSDRRDSRRHGNESRDESEKRSRKRSTDREYERERETGRSRSRSRRRSRSHSTSRFRYRERQVIPSHCIEQVPYPIYYSPRPIMVGPVMPIRGQVPIRGRLPTSMMGPMRPFPPRFIPSDMYRLGPPPPPNYRFGSMF